MDSLTYIALTAPPSSEAVADSTFVLGLDTARLFHHTTKPTTTLATERPYTVQGDNIITLCFVFSFITFVLMLTHWGPLVARHAKDFFYAPRNDADFPTSGTTFFVFMGAVLCFLMSIATYIYATESLGAVFAAQPQAVVMGVLTLLFMLYLGIKWLAYTITNAILFDSKKTQQWNHAYLLIVSFTAALLFPVVILLVYFDIPAASGALLCLFVLILNKILTIYKCRKIFFQQSWRYLQFFLYLCALEIAPLLALWGSWQMIVNLLKIKF